ncbi:MAG: ATP-binding protein [Nitrospirota bacterium]
MIHSFTCKNFYSFAGENTVKFEVNDKAPKNDGYFVTPSKTRLSKIETIIGANASGKTNLLKVLPFLKWLIIDSFAANPSAVLPVKMFILTKNKPAELSVDFGIDKDVFSYSFKIDEEKVLNEELKVKNKTKDMVTTKTLFARHWDNENKHYIFSGEKFDFPKKFENLILRKNASVISAAMRSNHILSEKIAQYWQKVETNVVEAGWIGDRLLPNATQNLFEVLNFYSENEPLKKEAEKLLRKFDLGFENIDIKKEKKEDGFTIDVNVIHSFGDKKHSLPLKYTSEGTKHLFVLLKMILQVLTNGGIAIIDEIDASLHPDMVMSLYELFISPETNPHNAQIIFSTHSHRILTEADKYQIVLTEKNNKGVTEAWRLDEVEGVRADDNYYTKYIAGVYGAIPKIN